MFQVQSPNMCLTIPTSFGVVECILLRRSVKVQYILSILILIIFFPVVDLKPVHYFSAEKYGFLASLCPSF